jgi:hypothetical protein
MAAVIGNGVSLRGIFFEDFQLPFNLPSDISRANDVGKAVTIDTASENAVKLAGSGDRVDGRLVVVEPRDIEGINVGTVAWVFADALPIDTASSFSFAVGDTAAGSPNEAGKVEPKNDGTSKTPDRSENVVVAVDTTNGFVTVLKTS